MKISFNQLLVALSLSLTSLAAERLVPSQYSSIQAAVDAAAAGDVIRLAAGEYREQANVISKRLSIVGDTGAVLHAHAEMAIVPWNNNVAIFAFERANVVLSNLVFEGNLQADTYPDRFMGIIYRSSSGRVENCTIRGFRASNGVPTRAVNVNNILENGVINVSVVGCSFSDNQTSLAIFGSDNTRYDLKTRFTVQSNRFTGWGADGSFVTGGLWVACGAEGSVRDNTFVDYTYYDSAENGSGAIFANDGLFMDLRYFEALKPVVYSGNVFSNNNVHILGIMATGSRITNNIFSKLSEGSQRAAVELSGANIVVADNDFENSSGGIQLYGQGDNFVGITKGIARNAKLLRNWFTNSVSILRTNTGVTFEEAGTETCCFAPTFLTVSLNGGTLITPVRSWHTEPSVLESSTNLLQWAPVRTNSFRLPIGTSEIPISAIDQHGFSRFRKTQ